MVDKLSALLTREGLVRYRFQVELAAAALYLVIAALEQRLQGGPVLGLAAVALATAIVLHRIAPAVALAIISVVPLVVVVTGLSGSTPSVTLWLPVLLVLFGAAAYGSEGTRWTGLAVSVLGGLFVVLTSLHLLQIVGLGFFVYFPAVMGFFLLPWIGGTLLRVNRSRQTAQTTATVATAERDRLAVSVALEQERNRVARDVHDIVAHSLAVVIAQADGARYAARKNPESIDGALETIAGTARAALSDVRSLLAQLRHSQEAGPQPGMADFDALIRGFRDSGLEIRWTSYGTATPLGDATGLAVYRIVQEALTNALRHGDRTSPVDLEFDWSETALTITVTNDLPEDRPPASSGGHGIPGMRERATLAGGGFTGGEGTNGRFRIRATLPVDRAAAPTQPTVLRPDAA